MEPDKIYPLHPDDPSQSKASSPLSDNENEGHLEVPSSYNQPRGAAPITPAGVPWYLRPLTKTTNAAITSSQTRPFIPREPLATVGEVVRESQKVPSTKSVGQTIQAPPLSPFRSRPAASIAPPSEQGRGAELPHAVGHFQMPGQSHHQTSPRPSPVSLPKPFSQFGTRPVETSPTKSKLPRKVIGIAVAVLLAGGIGAGVYSLWRSSNAPPATIRPAAVADAESMLYQAIENHLSVGKVRHVYEQTIVAGDTSVVKIDATSDFSDPRSPKSYINYESRSGEGEVVIEGAGQIITENANEYYGKLTKPALYYQGEDTARPKENQWYVLAPDDVAGEMLMDPWGVRRAVNSSLGEVPVGNFSEGTRQQLMAHIKDEKVYDITSSNQVEVDNKKMMHYTIAFNEVALDELNKKVFAATGGNSDSMPVDFASDSSQGMEMWVSEDKTRIVKIMIQRESTAGEAGKSVKESTVVTINYPEDTAIIAKPSNVTNRSWDRAGE